MSTRKYRLDQRAATAGQTRRRILDAAEIALAAEGYHRVTIAGLARDAGVSPQTIYNSIGSKAALVKALYDVRLAGDDAPVPIGDRPEFQAILAQPDAPSTLRAYIAFGCRLFERVGPLLAAVIGDGPGADTELQEFVARIEAERRTGNEQLINYVESRFGPGSVRSGQAAADVLWALTAYDLVDRLVRRCGWTVSELESWTGEMAVRSICGEVSSPARTPEQRQ